MTIEFTPLVTEELEAIDLEDDAPLTVHQPTRFRGWGRTVALVVVLGVMGAALVAGARHGNTVTKGSVAGVQEDWSFQETFDKGKALADKAADLKAQVTDLKDNIGDTINENIGSETSQYIQDLKDKAGALQDLKDKAGAHIENALGWGTTAQDRAAKWYGDVINYEFPNGKAVLDAAQETGLTRLNEGRARVRGAKAELVGTALGELCGSFKNLQVVKDGWIKMIRDSLMSKAGPCLNLKSQECKNALTVKACESLPPTGLRQDLCEVLFLKVSDHMQDKVPVWLVAPEIQSGEAGWVKFWESIQLGELDTDVAAFCAP